MVRAFRESAAKVEGPFTDYVPDLNLKPLSPYFVMSKLNNRSMFPDEAAMVKCIRDLLPIIKANGGIDFPKWTEDTPPWRVLEWTMRAIDLMCIDLDWDIKRAGRGKFYIDLQSDWSGEFTVAPLDYMPHIEFVNPDLHSLLLQMFKLLRKTGITILNNYHFEDFWMYERLSENLEYHVGKSEWDSVAQILNGRTNVRKADRLSEKITEARTSVEELNDAVNQYRKRHPSDDFVLDWIRESITLHGHHLADFTPYMSEDGRLVYHGDKDFDNEDFWACYENGEALPDTYIGFIWSDDDGFHDILQYDFESSNNNVDFMPLIAGQILKTDKDILDRSHSCWPLRLMQFINKGCKVADVLRNYHINRQLPLFSNIPPADPVVIQFKKKEPPIIFADGRQLKLWPEAA